MANADDDAMDSALEYARDGVQKDERSTKLMAALSVVTDLARQRWQIRVTESWGS